MSVCFLQRYNLDKSLSQRISTAVGKTATMHSPAIYTQAPFLPVIFVATDILRLLLLIFAAGVVRQWNMLPRGVLDMPTPSVFKGQARWGSEQPGIGEGSSLGQGRRNGTKGFLRSPPNQNIL